MLLASDALMTRSAFFSKNFWENSLQNLSVMSSSSEGSEVIFQNSWIVSLSCRMPWKSDQKQTQSCHAILIIYAIWSMYCWIYAILPSPEIKSEHIESHNTPHELASCITNSSCTFLGCFWKCCRFECELMMGFCDVANVSIIAWWFICAVSIIIQRWFIYLIASYPKRVSPHDEVLHCERWLLKFRTNQIDLIPWL